MSKHFHVYAYYLNADGTREPFDASFPCIRSRSKAEDVAFHWVTLQKSIYRAQMKDGDEDYPRFSAKYYDPHGLEDAIHFQATINDGSGVLAEIKEVDTPMHGEPGYEEYFIQALGGTILASGDDGVAAAFDLATAHALEMLGLGKRLPASFLDPEAPVH